MNSGRGNGDRSISIEGRGRSQGRGNLCRNGEKCTRTDCSFSHPSTEACVIGDGPKIAGRSQNDGYCRFGNACTRGDCNLKHPVEIAPQFRVRQEGGQGLKSAGRSQNDGYCRFGSACTRGDCNLKHSEEITPKLRDLQQETQGKHKAKLEVLSRSIDTKNGEDARLVPEDVPRLRQEVKALRDQQDVGNGQLREYVNAFQQIRKLRPQLALEVLKRENKRLLSGLPFYAFRSDVVEAVHSFNVTIIIGETGSGKSTQIAPFLLDSALCSDFRGDHIEPSGKIVVTQPRNLAAKALAERVAEEWGCKSGSIIGTLREGDRLGQRIAYCTDAKLLSIIRDNPNLDGIDCVVVDEVHERSVSTDLLLGCIKKILKRRPGLHLVLTSATMDRTVFQNFFREVCRHVDNPNDTVDVPVIEVPGRAFPVDDYYEEAEDDYVTHSWRKALLVHRKYAGKPGDIIVFLATLVDVESACKALRGVLGITHSYEGDNEIILPLHGKLKPEESQLVFAAPPHGKRKIIFSTNIAETRYFY